jgi:hypothetical protein
VVPNNDADKKISTFLLAPKFSANVTVNSIEQRIPVKLNISTVTGPHVWKKWIIILIQISYLKGVEMTYINTRAVCKVRGLTLLLRVGNLWRCGDGLFFEVPSLASDALLTTLHPDLYSLRNFLPRSSLFMVGKA